MGGDQNLGIGYVKSEVVVVIRRMQHAEEAEG